MDVLRIIITALLLLGAHLSLTAFVPTEAGKNWVGWPFAVDTQPALPGVGGLPQQGGSALTPLIAGIAGLCLLAAVASFFGWLVPTSWWKPLVVAGTVASIALFLLYLGPFSVLPIVIDVVLLWGIFAQQ